MRPTHYEPKVGDTITVELPDERTRATVERVISDEAVIAKIASFTTNNKSHNYKRHDLIACRFGGTSMNARGWKVVSDQELREPPAPEPELVETAEREMVAGDL